MSEMSEIDRRIAAARAGFAPQWLPSTNLWFAWRPIRMRCKTGGLRWTWWREVKVFRTLGITEYYEP